MLRLLWNYGSISFNPSQVNQESLIKLLKTVKDVCNEKQIEIELENAFVTLDSDEAVTKFAAALQNLFEG